MVWNTALMERFAVATKLRVGMVPSPDISSLSEKVGEVPAVTRYG
jgi:hypothetical protein